MRVSRSRPSDVVGDGLVGDSSEVHDVRERVRSAGAYAQAVYAADKISKVRELRLMMDRGVGGDAVAIKRERYLKSLAMLEDEIPESELVEILRLELETLPPEAQAEGT